MRIHNSALKHWVTAEDARHAATNWVYATTLSEDAQRASCGSGSILPAGSSNWSSRFDSGNELLKGSVGGRHPTRVWVPNLDRVAGDTHHGASMT